MGRTFNHHLPIDGQTFGFNLAAHKGKWRLSYLDAKGNRPRVMTTITVLKGDKTEEDKVAHSADMVAFVTKLMTPKKEKQAKAKKGMTWADLEKHLHVQLAANNNRKETYESYVSDLRQLAATLDETKGPGEIDDDLAEEFKTRYRQEGFTRSKAKDAKRYPRSAETVNKIIRTFRAVWNNYLPWKSDSNPWEEVEFAITDKEGPKAPDEQHVLDFLAWIKDERYKGWKLPFAFFLLKSITACRLEDLCTFQSWQIVGDKLTFTAQQEKSRRSRVFELPADVAKLVNDVKGKTHFWEDYANGLHKFNTRTQLSFSTSKVYDWAQRVMKAWAAKHPDKKLKTHDFRKRAVTRAYYEGGMTENQIADCFGMTVQNVKNYLDRSQGVPSAHFAQANKVLMPNISL